MNAHGDRSRREWATPPWSGVLVQVRCSSGCKSRPGKGRPGRVAIPAAAVTKPSEPRRQRRRKAVRQWRTATGVSAATAPKVTVRRPKALIGHALAGVKWEWGLDLFYSEVVSCVDPGAPLR